MSLWIIATLAAASLQTARFMLQKSLAAGLLSATGATFARFFFSAPVALVLLFGYLALSGQELPPLNAAFWLYGAMGGGSQILATVLVVQLFSRRSFAVGMTLKKTEVIQTVLIAWLLLGEAISLLAFLCILGGLAGVLLMSQPGPGGGRLRVTGPEVALGLSSGVFFAVSGVCYRGASLELPLDAPMLRAGITLAAVLSMQFAVMVVWLRLRAPGEITRVWAARRVAALVALTSMLGSFCWFTAFTLQNAAYVNALGQVELILSLAVSVLFYREAVSRREIGGIALLGASIVGLVLVT
jgi:drug/metabolite transporter (DMT)-like permease